MAPRFEKFTVKAREAVQAAQSLADQREHQAIEPEHLLLALLEQQEGIVGPLLAKLGGQVDGSRRDLDAQLGTLPKVRGASGSYMSQALGAVFERAQAEADRFKDEYVSTEHLLLGIAQERGGGAGQVLARHGVTQ